MKNRTHAQLLLSMVIFILGSPIGATNIVESNEETNLGATFDCNHSDLSLNNIGFTRYFKDAFYALDVNARAFIGHHDKGYHYAEDPKYIEHHFGFAHHNIEKVISLLGKLLPRLERAIDLPILIEQFEKGEIHSATTNLILETLRVSLAREILKSLPQAGDDTATFLTALQQLEAQLLSFKSGQLKNDQIEALNDLDNRTRLAYKVFAAITKKIVFADDFKEKIQRDIKVLCQKPTAKDNPE